MVHRKLVRTADHRVSLLRNLVTNVLEHESITTTHAKAKEAQTAVERVITAAKHLHSKRGDTLRDTQLLKNKFYKQEEIFPKLMGELRERYSSFTGGYTRVLRLEPRLGDNAPQSILELINGKRDMRFALTAKAVARAAALGEPLTRATEANVKKITKSPESAKRFEAEVEVLKAEHFGAVKQGSDSVQEVISKGKQRAPIELRPNPLTATKN